MNNDLSLKFLRVVNEVGLNGWGQVYARMPFEAEEESRKGALFGAVFSKGESNPDKESEMLVWADEYYNGADKGGSLSDFWEKFESKFEGMDSVWVWVSIEQGKRKLRMVRKGESGIVIYRQGNRVEVTGKSGQGRVITGDAISGDEMLVWAGGLGAFTKELEDENQDEEGRVDGVVGKLVRDQIGASGLVLRFGEMDLVEKISETEENIDVEKPIEQRIVTSRLVGPVKPRDRIVNWWRRFNSRERMTVSTREGMEKKKKLAVGLGLLFLVLLAVSLVMGSVKIRNDKEAARWATFAEPIEKKRLEADNLSKLNQVGAKKLLEEARSAFEEGKGDFTNKEYGDRLTDLENKLGQSWQTASGEKESELVNQINFDLVRQGFSGSKIVWVEDSTFFVLDGALGVVARVETEQKEIKIIAGKGEGQGWIDLVFYGKSGFILSNDGLGLIASEVKITNFDSAVSDPSALGIFGSNLYLIDKGNREIYKFGIVGDSVGERQRWLKQDEAIDITTPLDLAIDGDVWVVGGSDKLEKFRRGVREHFSLSSVPEGAMFTRVSAELDGERVALLDSTHGWIVLFKKEDGSFISQFNSEKFKEAGDIEFDGQGKLWVLIKGVMAEVR